MKLSLVSYPIEPPSFGFDDLIQNWTVTLIEWLPAILIILALGVSLVALRRIAKGLS